MPPRISLDIAQFSVAPGGAPARQPELGQKWFPPMHNRRRPEVAMLLYPGMTLLDTLGPQGSQAMKWLARLAEHMQQVFGEASQAAAR